jgi:DNA-binding NarL/FixJ family response regulator
MPAMTAVAIYCADLNLCEQLQRLLREAASITLVGTAADPHALSRLAGQSRIDAVLADAMPPTQLKEWRGQHPGAAIIALVDAKRPEEALDALHAGAAAVLPRSAGSGEIVAAIEVARKGLAVVPADLIETLLDPRSPEAGEPLAVDAAAKIMLTARELDVLAAMADGASNKVIARRLGISFHTAKFHVAAILAKLDADSRTEAVAKAAHLGLVML